MSEDERYLVVNGRRWRRSDPAIPEALRSELVRELMSARRAVGAAKKAADSVAERAARARVQDAKVALGERGHPYWQDPNEAALQARALAAIRALLTARGPAKTICPSDVARIVGAEGWRTQMPLVRQLALELEQSGQLEIRQKGEPVPAKQAKGPIRLAQPTPAKRKRTRKPPTSR